MFAKEITGDLLIGSEAVRSGSRSLRAVDPSTGSPLDPAFVAARDEDVSRACVLARDAFDVYRSTGLEERARFLEAIARNILDLDMVLVDRAMAETGLPKARIEGERGRTVGQLRLFADLVRRGEWLDLRVDPAQPDRKPLPRPDLRLRQIPLGPVAVFGASNFPLAFSVAGGDTASAFAAGCPVIVKSHPAHPGTGELVGRAVVAAVAECGLPDGTFSLLLGGIETGIALARHADVKAIGFTGSREGGLALAAVASQRPEPIPVYAEMSSINPVFLLPEALRARAAELATGFVDSLTLGSGQFCTNPGLIFAVAGPELDRFVAAASTRLAEREPAVMLTSGIFSSFKAGVRALAENPAVRSIGNGVEDAGINRERAALFMTDAASFAADRRLSKEVFGASGLVVSCSTFEEMVSIANALEGQLTATLQIDPADFDLARRLIPVLERKVGRILANGWPTGVEVAPAMVHGGPFPATSDSRTTSVGTLAIRRFLRPVSYQALPDELLPPELRADRLADLPHAIDGVPAARDR